MRCATPLQIAEREGVPRPVCPACGYVVYEDPKLAAGVVLERDGRVLLLERATNPGRDKLTFPGGYVDRGEPVEDAAVRETAEEVGITAAIDSLLGVYSAAGNPVVLVVYRATVAAGEPHPTAEARAVGWYGANELPWTQLAFPSTAAALRDWARA